MNGNSVSNAAAAVAAAATVGVVIDGERKKKSKESFEAIPLLTACLTYMGFYFLMLLGFLNQLLFKPKVATEKNRDVSHVLHLRPHEKKKNKYQQNDCGTYNVHCTHR